MNKPILIPPKPENESCNIAQRFIGECPFTENEKFIFDIVEDFLKAISFTNFPKIRKFIMSKHFKDFLDKFNEKICQYQFNQINKTNELN